MVIVDDGQDKVVGGGSQKKKMSWKSHKLKVCGPLRQVQFKFKPGSNRFSEIDVWLNLGLNFRSGSAKVLNFELNFGPVLRSSGSNFGITNTY
jgi:hypothetical protein